MRIIEDQIKPQETLNFDVTNIPGDDEGFIALVSGDDWTGLSGFGGTVKEALLDLLEEMQRTVTELAESKS